MTIDFSALNKLRVWAQVGIADQHAPTEIRADVLRLIVDYEAMRNRERELRDVFCCNTAVDLVTTAREGVRLAREGDRLTRERNNAIVEARDERAINSAAWWILLGEEGQIGHSPDGAHPPDAVVTLAAERMLQWTRIQATLTAAEKVLKTATFELARLFRSVTP